jgi:hypothetical protein
MAIRKLTLLCLLGLSTFLHFQPAATAIDETAFTASDIIERDVCIIGGGASGTYAAVRLRQIGKSVALIEKEDRLGGHVNTYVDPVSGVSFDYGAAFWVNISVVVDYARSLNIPLGILNDNHGLGFGNFANGSLVPASELPSVAAQAKALLTYRKKFSEYPYITNGFDLPDPVPEDLLLPFGEFIQKYNITAISTVTFLVAQGAANLLAQPTLYIMKYFLQPRSMVSYMGILCQLPTRTIKDYKMLRLPTLAMAQTSSLAAKSPKLSETIAVLKLLFAPRMVSNS